VEIWTRVIPGIEYVKVVVHRGKVVGALLIGDTNLEEVFENLILNRLDVSHLGVEMLDPSIDIEDYFD
jgi:NAD(P)H-nitrite reductase large subunit